jgi:hypothetical protein
MKPIDRRRFLLTTAATAALPSLRSLAQTPPTQTATLTLHPDRPGPQIPANFIGLSYETQQLSDPTFFSAANTGLIAQFRALTPNGVLRLGGNTSDLGWWRPTSDTPQPTIQVRDSHGAEPTANSAFPITPEAVHNLRAFLDATGWTCLYGINLGTNTPARAADEAAFVTTVLGPKLEYFQLGNEPDGYSTHLRDPNTWSANAFFDDWLAEANAIRARVPSARFGMPDVGWRVDWVTVMADRLLATPNRPNIAALSHHYYVGGPPSSPEMTIPFILRNDPRVAQDADISRAAAAKLNVPFRMTEGNTCYRGGKPGVSDTFASALWAADYLLRLASLGYAGVNLHGGDAKMVASSLGGTLPGDALVLAQHGDPATHPHPYYTPIAHISDNYLLEPVAYGMKFAQQFAGTTMIPLDFNPGPVNATAYAMRWPSGRICLAIINKDATQDLHLDLRDWIIFKTLTSQRSGDSELEARNASLIAWLANAPSRTAHTFVPRSSASFFLHTESTSAHS